jgi:DNA-binding transcriptional ArsR family regulator
MTGGSADMSNDRADVELTPDVTFELLSNPQRRYALAYLSRRGQPITARELAEQIAAWEQDKPVSEVEDETAEQIQMTLHHNHIPKLRAVGLVDQSERGEGFVLESTDKVNQVEAELSVGLEDGPTKHYTT